MDREEIMEARIPVPLKKPPNGLLFAHLRQTLITGFTEQTSNKGLA